MSPVRVGSTSPARRLRASVVLFSLGFALLSAQPGQAQAPPLTFFKNYFITGDYVVEGVGLRGQGINGVATGSIQISDVPPDADIVAAFLYWQVVTTTTAGPDSGSLLVTFKGHPLRSTEGPFAKVLNTVGTAPCWASGGSTGSSGGSKKTFTYRADVLRYFDVDPATQKLAVNGAHAVGVPDSGSGGNATPLALGASLVVIYRLPTLPLSAIVIYDGGYTLDNSTGAMFQTIEGFYQPANPAVAKMTHIVGSGQLNKSETLLFDVGTTATHSIATNPFRASAGDSWDNPPFVDLNLGTSPGSVTQVTTGVSPSSDCLTWGAIVFKTEVEDSDHDGLVDVWETSPSLVDPNGRPLPNLTDGAMGGVGKGAAVGDRDLFIEIGYMETIAATPYGGVSKPAHSHLPTHAALKLMGDAFANAPTGRVNVHFDVGNAYPPGEADEYIIRGTGARGGDGIGETVTQCTRLPTDPPWVCQFSAYPGTVGWKSGFRFLRDQVFSVTPTPPPTTPPTPLEDYCDVPVPNSNPVVLYTCDRRFDRNRKDIFRYALFAHALGLPQSEEPCLDNAVPPNAVPPSITTGRCDAPLRDNPDFHVPRTNTGVGDFPGGDVMVTLGAFADVNGAPIDDDLNPLTPEVWTPFPVGTPFMQASTLMHEMGHNMERRHGGEALEPNCKPTYLSVMNYLYQLRGLLDNDGKPHLDFSGEVVNPALNETSLFDGFVSGSSKRYRLGWYAPLLGSYLEARGTAASRHCDGSDLLPAAVPMVRIDARAFDSPIDWNANGTSDASYLPGLDINFNGRVDGSEVPPAPLLGSDDWTNLKLNQLGGRRNTGGLFVVDSANHLLVGPLSLDSGRGDLGRGDLGRGDLGRGDLGRGDLGRGDLGRGDLGGGDLFVGNPYPEGELDAATATALARTPPNEFTACVIGVSCTGATTATSGVLTGWKAPNIGGVTGYLVYRVVGSTILPGQTWELVAGSIEEVEPGKYTLVDHSALYATEYTYFAVASYADEIKSDPSNLVTRTTPRASSTVTVTCPASVTYNGTAQTPCAATYTTADGLSGPLAVSYTANTNAGPAGASAAYAGDASHEASSNSATFAIGKAASTVTVSCPPTAQTYTGSAIEACTASYAGAGGLTGALTPAYVNNLIVGTATASASYAGDANHEASSGSATFTIGTATSTTVVTCPASVTYNGAAQTPCSVAVTGAGGLGLTPAPIYANNTNAGTASASYTFAGDANHAGSTDAVSFTIAPAPSSTVVSCPATVTYNGAAQTPCTVAVTGAGGLSLVATPTYANNINAGTGTASASYTYAGDANHADSTDAVSFTIAPAPSSTVVSCPATVTYNGAAQTPCTVAVTGAGGLSLVATPTYANNINAGIGTASASYTYAGDANHSGSAGAVSFTIAKATPIFSGLSGPTIKLGATPTALGGTLKAGSLIPTGSVSITLNGVPPQAAGITATGTFSSSFATGALTVAGSPYTITYSYPGDANFTAAGPDTSKSLTVQPQYSLFGLQNVPPAVITKTKAGSSVPMKWQFKNGSIVVSSSQVHHRVTVTGPASFVVSDTDSGGSSFRYDATANAWYFNLQTKDANGLPYPIGNYTVTITPTTPGYLPSPPFTLTLTK